MYFSALLFLTSLRKAVDGVHVLLVVTAGKTGLFYDYIYS